MPAAKETSNAETRSLEATSYANTESAPESATHNVAPLDHTPHGSDPANDTKSADATRAPVPRSNPYTASDAVSTAHSVEPSEKIPATTIPSTALKSTSRDES